MNRVTKQFIYENVIYNDKSDVGTMRSAKILSKHPVEGIRGTFNLHLIITFHKFHYILTRKRIYKTL